VTERVWNFSAGPATLPLPVLERARDELLSLPGVGASALEISHRSAAFERIVGEAEANLRELLGIPPSHRVLFLQGGASLQFAMVPMNLLRDGPGAYVVSGAWSEKAIAEARTIGRAEAVWDGGATGFSTVPDLRELELEPATSYLHVTSNETMHGVQFRDGFEPGGGPTFVCDASSDFLARPIEIERYDLLYAGAQKNAGPAGVTIVVIRDELLGLISDGVPTILDYRTHAQHGSRYNTPPVFGIYMVGLVTRWLRDEIGGVEKMREINAEKAALVYEAIDRSNGFYRGHARPEARSLVNVTFRLPSEELDAAFVAEAERAGLIELAGHRSVGGIRASIYNAMPVEGVRALREVMDDFRSRRG
jgi:phosphoserine aminotransferase